MWFPNVYVYATANTMHLYLLDMASNVKEWWWGGGGVLDRGICGEDRDMWRDGELGICEMIIMSMQG